MSALSRSMADFSVHLYQKAAEAASKEDNVFLSPLSVAYALAMCYAGAGSSTKDQMKQVLFGKVKFEDKAIHDAFANIMTTLNNPNAAYKLLIANRLYANESFAPNLLQVFVDLLLKKYGSEMHLVNFQEANGEVARKKINDWVSQQTNDKIQDLIASGVLNDDTRLVLVNAIYFKADWLNHFEKEATEEKPFYAQPNKELKLQTMHKYGEKLAYGESDQWQVLGIPYEGEELAMFIFLPKERYGLAKIEKELNGEKILRGMLMTTYTEIEVVALPKFKLEQSFSLAEALKQMGATKMFTDRADFSNITGKKDLHVSDVIHKAFVEVNEVGTEAAAATAEVLRGCCLDTPVKPPVPPKFIANHPFLFTIFDEGSKSILFLGRYNGK